MKIARLAEGLIFSCNGIGVVGMEGSLIWIGVDYELEAEHNLFEYEIEFFK